MRLDHVNLTVMDVEKVSALLRTHFGLSDTFGDKSPSMAVLGDEHGMHINLMKGRDPTYPKTFHIGFDMGNEAAVDAKYEELKAGGLETTSPQHASWGSYTFHFTCPGGDFTIEVECAPDGWA